MIRLFPYSKKNILLHILIQRFPHPLAALRLEFPNSKLRRPFSHFLMVPQVVLMVYALNT
jgi:hypothetical protein